MMVAQFGRAAAYRRIFAGSALAISTLLVGAAGAHAQMERRDVSGTVTDQHNEPLKGAVVYVENEATMQVITYVTDLSGVYSFKRLDGNTDYKLWAMYRGVSTRKHHLSKFDSKSERTFHLAIRVR